MPKLHWDKLHFLIILKNERGGGEAQRDSYSVIHEETLDNPIEIMAGQTQSIVYNQKCKDDVEGKRERDEKGKYMAYKLFKVHGVRQRNCPYET